MPDRPRPVPHAVLGPGVRCRLRAQRRRIEGARHGGFEAVDHLEVDGTLHVDWDEAIEKMVDVQRAATLLPGGPFGWVKTFSFDGGREFEELAGRRRHGRRSIRAAPRTGSRSLVRIAISRPDPASSYVKVAVTVENTTEVEPPRSAPGRGHAAFSLISVHTMLAVDDGRFVSLLDPPDDAVRVARTPAGATGRTRSSSGMTTWSCSASPIILYDHPEVAPQSPGDLYDSLEIDEILALRVMTLTDGEKSEARGTDPRAAAIHLDRCDDMSADTLSAPARSK